MNSNTDRYRERADTGTENTQNCKVSDMGEVKGKDVNRINERWRKREYSGRDSKKTLDQRIGGGGT